MYEVVDYRNCDCGDEMCPGERETVLFQHKDKPMCIDFMKRESLKFKTRHYDDTKDKMRIRKRLRVQEVIKNETNKIS